MSVPGITELPHYGIAIAAEIREKIPKETEATEYYCDYEELPAPLSVRIRQPGDRIVFRGGRKKLKDFFSVLS